MIQYNTIYDISISLGKESIDYPGDTPFSIEQTSTIQDGGTCDLSTLVLSAHSGTHIDTPAHFIAGARTLDSYSLEEYILPARVVNITNKVAIEPDELEKLDIEPDVGLLFQTDNSASGRCTNGIFSEDYVYLTPEAADYCIEKRTRLVGIDYISIEKYGDKDHPAHRKLMGNDVLILEGINLQRVPPGNYTLLCFPLKIAGAEASPVRALLLG